MKKIASIIGAGAILLGMATPVLGWWNVSTMNMASVKNYTTTKAGTGGNLIGGMSVFGESIKTGNASAVASVDNQLNTTLVGNVVSDVTAWNGAYVMNSTYTKARTGNNSIGGMYVGGGIIDTGSATAKSVVGNIVNYTQVGLIPN